MFPKLLKQLTLSSTRGNADVVGLARFYSSPAVCQTLTTSKARKRLSRDDRRALVVSFVSEYRAANAGKFPSLNATLKEVGGGYYVVRGILQELKLNPNAHLPIVAKTLSEVPASVPVDTSSQTLYDADTEHVSSVVAASVPIDTSSDVPASVSVDTSSQTLYDADTEHVSSVVAASVPIDTSSEVPASVPIDTSSQTLYDADTEHVSSVVPDPVFQDGSSDTIEAGSDQSPGTIDSSHPNSDESDLQGNNLVVAATHDKTATETAPVDDVDSKCHSDSNSQTLMVSEECLKNSESEEEEKLTHLGSQESKADDLEGAAVSADVLPTETRQVSEEVNGEVKTGESSSAWSSIMSFAREFVNIWRKG